MQPTAPASAKSKVSRKTVVACHGPGPDYILDEGKAGLLIKPDDQSGLSQAILTLLDNHDHRNQLAVAGHTRVRTHFTDSVVLPAYEALFDRVRSEQ